MLTSQTLFLSHSFSRCCSPQALLTQPHPTFTWKWGDTCQEGTGSSLQV